MSNLSNFVNVVIRTITAGTPRESCGIPLILSPTALFSERVQEYADLDEMEDAGFTAAMGEYKAASAMFAQNPRPERVLIGRCANQSQMKFRLTPSAVNSVAYTVEVDGEEATFTADSSATVAEITAGLKIEIDALSNADVTTTDNTTSLDITFTAGETGHSVRVAPTMSSRLAVAQTTTDPGLAADWAAIKVERNDWYGVINLFNSKAQVDALAALVEADEKFFIAATSDSACINTSLSGTDDVMESTRGTGYVRTMVQFHSYPDQFLDAATMGRAFPEDAGSETYHLLRLAGITVDTLNSTQRANIAAKNGSYFVEIGAKNLVIGGKVAMGEWGDIVRARDAIKSDIEVAVFNVLSADVKNPYTNAGITKVQGAILAALREYVPSVLSESPAPVVNVPDISTVSTADKATRTLNDVTFDAVLTGAIYAVNLTGTLSV